MTLSKIICLLFLVLMGCTTGNKDALKLTQYLNQGSKLYQQHCSNCHQTDGSGLGQLIPPLNNNFSSENIVLTVCSIKNGLEGVITVEDKTYDRIMPANRQLTSLEIAQITTYITNSWGQQNGLTDVLITDSILTRCN